jgi:cysteine synthase
VIADPNNYPKYLQRLAAELNGRGYEGIDGFVCAVGIGGSLTGVGPH